MKLILASILASSASAQVESNGVPTFGMSKTLRGFSSPITHVMPSLNSTTVDGFRKRMGQGLKNGGFAVPQPVSVNANKDGTWSADGVWRYAFQATDKITKGMYVAFDQFEIPDGATVFVYTDEGKVAGAFTSKNNKKAGLMIRPLQGKQLTVEYNSNGATTKPRLSIDIVGQAYAAFPGYKDEDPSKGPSGFCNVNTACEEADEWRNEVSSVGILMTSSGGGYCSGSMINNKDGKQYFLTAAHCTPSARDVVGFNFDEETCDGNSNNIQKDSAAGLTTIFKNTGSDCHLVEIDEEIPSSYNIYLAGYNGEDVTEYTDVTCISHPSADRKKFTQHYGEVDRTGYITSDGESHWHVATWELGTTEGGSSGSPLFNANKEIIGQLHGGYASCTYNFDDYYGSLAVSFENGLGDALGAISMEGAAL